MGQVLDTCNARVALFTVIAAFGTAQDVTADELRVESVFPADLETAALSSAASEAARPDGD